MKPLNKIGITGVFEMVAGPAVARIIAKFESKSFCSKSEVLQEQTEAVQENSGKMSYPLLLLFLQKKEIRLPDTPWTLQLMQLLILSKR